VHSGYQIDAGVRGDGTRVVIKRLRAELRDRGDLVARLLAEGRYLGALRGEHGVLRCYETRDSPAALTLEHAAGGSLVERQATPLACSDAVQLFRGVSNAVAHAHAHGIIHRDIKPSNILFTASGELRLADFGIAVHRGARSTADGWEDIDIGTLGYAPPELLRDPSTANTEPVDIYELGALLHEMLLGATPHMMHGDESELELRARIVAGATRDLTPREQSLPPELRALLDSALDPAPERRPQSVAELLALLDAL
jgi:eukaryotic-like serine/threonine-protein kinase